jgi:DNA-binding transcriptional MerR regulator
MEENLISKKELLEMTGISYGQLYRWKRKNLIPEEWFIKKSSFTGQETYFPKDRILDRINVILQMKDDVSLDDLAERFQGTTGKANFSIQELVERNIVTQHVVDMFKNSFRLNDEITSDEMVYLSLYNQLLSEGNLNIDEINFTIKGLIDNYTNIKNKDYELVFIRRLGVGIGILAETGNVVLGDGKILERININSFTEKVISNLV